MYFIVNDEAGIVCGYALDTDGSTPTSLPIGFCPYNQILRHKSVTQNSVRCVGGERFLIHSIVKKFGKFNFISSPKNQDVRSALFLEHDVPEVSASVKLKYTAIIDIGSETSLETTRRNYKKRRKHGIKKAEKHGYVISKNFSLDELKNLYKSTFSRNGLFVDESELKKMELIVHFAEKNCGYVVLVRDSQSVASAAAVCLTDRDTAYSIFILNDENSISDGCASLCVDAAISKAYEFGLSRFDFIGANSPGRGDFKLSFGAELKPYYQLGVSIEN